MDAVLQGDNTATGRGIQCLLHGNDSDRRTASDDDCLGYYRGDSDALVWPYPGKTVPSLSPDRTLIYAHTASPTGNVNLAGFLSAPDRELIEIPHTPYQLFYISFADSKKGRCKESVGQARSWKLAMEAVRALDDKHERERKDEIATAFALETERLEAQEDLW